MINQIITAKIMSMDMAKYHRLITAIEETGWFKKLVKSRELEINYCHHMGSVCNTGTLGRFTENGFLFSCKHFAVTYNVSPKVAVDKNWHTLRHINQRNSITNRLLGIIGRLQGKYLLTHDPITLRRLPYQQIVDEYERLFPESYIDFSVISRLVKNNIIEVNSKAISLNELLPRESYLIGVRILKLLETMNPLLSDGELRKELANKFDLHLSRRHVSYCRNLMGIPEARLRKKTNSIFFHWDSVNRNHYGLGFWIQSLRPQVFMCLA
jgi:DNA-directed RNA polymerase specialized sigma54-like protein